MSIKARTAIALGWLSVARVVSYRIGVKFGLNPVRRLVASPAHGTFFDAIESPKETLPARRSGDEYLEGFGCKLDLDLSQSPDWFKSIASGSAIAGADANWWEIPDFDPEVGDIKGVWELSRFDWVLAAAQNASRGEEQALNRLNLWLQDWSDKNPPYKGPNWKCGQESSIRVLHLLAAALILDQAVNARPALIQLVEIHLKRIAPTIRYAVGQDNNHGTSEAAALFVGGAWLAVNGRGVGERWSRIGREWLEDRVNQLIQADGSFSQYSLTYHRLMLDTLCLVETARRKFELPAFSNRYLENAKSATRWLFTLLDPQTGDGPNVGANDGAHILKMTDADYRDFRPSVQMASVLFLGRRAYAQPGPWDDGLGWLGLDLPEKCVEPPSRFLSDDGGFAVMRCGVSMAMLRYPRFRFRPSQADLLHVDLWCDGDNLLRDAGTYSYNTAEKWLNYFGGTEGHNTIQFDGRDQMPRLSRFLFGAWVKTDRFLPLREENGVQKVGAGFRGWQGASHYREVEFGDFTMRVRDEIDGFSQKAVLRWRLTPGVWTLEETAEPAIHTWRLCGPNSMQIVLSSSIPVYRCELVEGWESRYYGQKTGLPVVELEVHSTATLVTQVDWRQ